MLIIIHHKNIMHTMNIEYISHTKLMEAVCVHNKINYVTILKLYI